MSDSTMPQDPFLYVGRVHRDSEGHITMEVFTPEDDEITVAQGDEFITFTTVIDLTIPRT